MESILPLLRIRIFSKQADSPNVAMNPYRPLWQTYEPTDKYSLAFSGSSQLFHRSNSTSQGILIVE